MSARGRPSGARRGAAGDGARARRPAALTLRPAQAGDLVPLSFFFDTALRRDYFLRRGQLRDILSGRHHQTFVAEMDGVLVGVAITTRGTRLVNALVHPAYRGLGIGQALVRESGATEVRAKLDMSSGDPRGFYEALGFRGTGQFNEKGNIQLMRVPQRGDGRGARGRAGVKRAGVAQGARRGGNHRQGLDRKVR